MTHSHADCPVSIGRASITMEDSDNLPDAVYSLNSEHSTTAFIELSTALDDPFDSFRPPDSRPLDTYDATKPCHLFAIPRELRDMISDYTISIGAIQILQTSKKLREEGTHFLYKRRTCHINVDLTNYVPTFSLQKSIAALIQNVNIDVSLDSRINPRLWRHNIKQIAKFSGATVPRQMCRVVVLYTVRDHNSIVLGPEQWFMSQIRTLTGFSLLTLEVQFRNSMSGSQHQDWPVWFNYMFRIMRKEMEVELGPSSPHKIDDCGGQYFEFHPRGYWEANTGSLSEIAQRRIKTWTENPEGGFRKGTFFFWSD